MTEVEVIQGVIDRLKDPAHWVKHTRALTASGYHTNPSSEDAAVWCLGGAVMNVIHDEEWTGWYGTDAVGQRFHELAIARGYDATNSMHPFVAFNNDPDTTHEDLMLFLKEALYDAEIDEYQKGAVEVQVGTGTGIAAEVERVLLENLRKAGWKP